MDFKNDLLKVNKLEYFPSGSLSSFQPSAEDTESEEIIEKESSRDSLKLEENQIIEYEKESLRNTLNEQQKRTEDQLSKVLSENLELKTSLKELEKKVLMMRNSENYEKKITDLTKINSELKEDLLVYGSKINELDKKLKEAKNKLKGLEKDKSFLLFQMKNLVNKIWSHHEWENSKFSNSDLLNESFYKEIHSKLEKIIKGKSHSQSLFTPAVELTPCKSFCEVKVSQSLQTEPDLQGFQEKYSLLKNWQKGQNLGKKGEVKVLKEEPNTRQSSKYWDQGIKAKNVLQDLKRFGL
jgi:hypothetical protein